MRTSKLSTGAIRFIVLAALWLAATLSTQAQPAATIQPQYIKGTRVCLMKPAGFTDAQIFSGFQDGLSGASVMVTEIPGPYESCIAGFTEAGLKSKGMTLTSRAETKVGSFPGVLIEATQIGPYRELFRKLILCFGDASVTVTVVANCPDSQWARLSKSVRSAVLTARLDKQMKPPDPREGLTYNVPDSAEMKLAKRLQNTLLFTVDGQLTPSKDAEKSALFVVAQSISEVPISNKSEYSRQRLLKNDKLQDFKIESDEEITVNGLPGRQIIATAFDPWLGKAVHVCQTMLFTNNTYYILLGQVDLSKRQTYEPVFKKMTQTFQKK